MGKPSGISREKAQETQKWRAALRQIHGTDTLTYPAQHTRLFQVAVLVIAVNRERRLSDHITQLHNPKNGS